MDFGGMLKKAQEMQQKMAEVKASLKNIQAEGVANNGAVKVIMNGDHEMIKIDIDPKLMTEEKEVLEDLIVIATSNAKKVIEVKSSEEMSKITGGLKLPPGFKLPF
jgi:nucleoid-associated protein EbfC